MNLGPMQLLVVGFDQPSLTGEIITELDRLREHDVIRLIDLIVVRKDADGSLEAVRASDLSLAEAEQVGALAGALIGLGAAGEAGAEAGARAGAARVSEDGHVLATDDAWYIADVIPAESSAAVALIEHRWAVPLRDAVRASGGVPLADEWIHPTDLVAVGVNAATPSA